MNAESRTETIACPCCGESESSLWVRENDFTAVKCAKCGLVYVNPRPIASLIAEGVETGVHSNVDHGRTAIVRRVPGKVALYRKILGSMFSDVWQSGKEISWLDVGAGYGEFLEAVSALAPTGSRIEGLEPMEPKAVQARARGLTIRQQYLSDVTEKFEYLSLVNVFSHIPDFHAFLQDMKNVLTEDGELFLETGNIGDLVSSHEVPSELDLPDHLVFAGEQNMVDFLSNAGFTIIDIRRKRRDGFINFGKNIIKKIIGRQVALAIPYTSKYRAVMFRARLAAS